MYFTFKTYYKNGMVVDTKSKFNEERIADPAYRNNFLMKDLLEMGVKVIEVDGKLIIHNQVADSTFDFVVIEYKPYM